MEYMTELQRQAATVIRLRGLGFDDAKAAAHADVTPAAWPSVLEEIERQSITPEERAAKASEARLEALYEQIEALAARVAALESAPVPQQAIAQGRKKPDISPEERQRRSDHMKALLAKRREAKEAGDSW